jgi:hypothetical protein
MEEQLGGAVRDLDGAGHLWATACKTASLKAAAGKSLGSLGYVTIEERLMALIERTRRAWEQVAITAGK